MFSIALYLNIYNGSYQNCSMIDHTKFSTVQNEDVSGMLPLQYFASETGCLHTILSKIDGNF